MKKNRIYLSLDISKIIGMKKILFSMLLVGITVNINLAQEFSDHENKKEDLQRIYDSLSHLQKED